MDNCHLQMPYCDIREKTVDHLLKRNSGISVLVCLLQNCW